MGRRTLIGAIIADCQVDFQEEVLRGIISQAFRSNCDVAVLAPLHNFYMNSPHKQEEKYIFDLILSDRFDGFLYDRLTFASESIRKYIDGLLMRSGKPVMLVDSGEHRSFETTSIDDCEAFETITDHLITVHGLKRIYCLTGPRGVYVAEERLKGYRNSMKKHGLYFDKTYIRYGDFWSEAAKQLAADIISGSAERPEAVICGNDITAVNLARELIAAGIRVPEDVAVTGYDASADAAEFTPSITTYSRPNFQMGAEAFRRLYRIITGHICSKIPNDNGGLRLGKSCGCCPASSSRTISRASRVNRTLEGNLLYGDMLFDITNAENCSDFADKLDRYTYFIYRMRHIGICLTKKYIESPGDCFGEKLTFRCGDDMKMILSKSAVERRGSSDEYFSSEDLLPMFGEERSYPSAYYISPLHYNDNFFGYAALSFGKTPMSFSSLYLQWINYVNIALEQVRIKAFMKCTIASTNRALLYDDYTGLPNRTGLQHEFAARAAEAPKGQELSAECIRIQLTGISKAYYQSGEEKCRRLRAAFARAVKACLHDDELLGIWSSSSLGVITFCQNRAEQLYPELCARIKESGFSGDSCNIDFTMGMCSIPLRSDQDIPGAMHKAAVNRLYTYNLSDQASNPQFEKLCMLRNRIMKNPENSWNISEIADSLYLSKSYLQKIYKSYFGKSIIEEMIQFRIDKAKELLSKTSLTVTEISRECGYSSYNYFVRQFKSAEGVSPSEYRTSVSTSE